MLDRDDGRDLLTLKMAAQQLLTHDVEGIVARGALGIGVKLGWFWLWFFFGLDQFELIGVIAHAVAAPQPEDVIFARTLGLAVVARNVADPVGVGSGKWLLLNFFVEDSELGFHIQNGNLARRTLVGVLGIFIKTVLVDCMPAWRHVHDRFDGREHEIAANWATGHGCTFNASVVPLQLNRQTS